MNYIKEIINIPVWWLIKKPHITFSKILFFTKAKYRSLGILFLIRNLHKPLFGFTSIADHIISLLVRLGHLVIIISYFLIVISVYTTGSLLVLVSPVIGIYLSMQSSNNSMSIGIILLVMISVFLYEKDFNLKKLMLKKKYSSNNLNFNNALKELSPDSKNFLMELSKSKNSNSYGSILRNIIDNKSVKHLLRILEVDSKNIDYNSIENEKLSIKNHIIYSFEIAWNNNYEAINIEIIFASLFLNKKLNHVLDNMEITYEEILNAIQYLDSQKKYRQECAMNRKMSYMNSTSSMNRGMTGKLSPTVDRLTTDLTQKAKKLKFSNIIGRENSYEEIIKVISEKKFPLIIGNSGSGKTNIINYLAQKMSIYDVPTFLQDKRLVQLNISNLLSGIENSHETDANKYLVKIIEEISGAGHIILVIDEISNLYGIKQISNAKFDLLQSLVEMSNAYNMTLLATTSSSNYDKYILNDPVTLSHFQPVELGNLSLLDLDKILQLKSSEILENYNKTITLNAINRSKSLADRFISNISSPAKEISIIENSISQSNNNYITEENILSSVKVNYGIDMTNSKERADLLGSLEKNLHKEIIGQKEAVKAVSNALRRASMDLGDNNGPLASFMFLGPTGVGKTELAKVTAKTFFNNKNNFLRIDMSEYPDKKSIYKLIGYNSESGYIPGTLTEPIKNKPFSLILFDEIEKADPEVLDIFLQLLDDGIVTDGLGNKVNFKNTIIIATSNVGNRTIQDRFNQSITYEEIQSEVKDKILPEKFRLEFINRFSRVITFLPLDNSEITDISNLVMNQITSQLEKKGIKLTYDSDISSIVVEKAYNPLYGARNVKNFLKEVVNNFIAKELLATNNRKPVIHFGMQDMINSILPSNT